MKQTIRITIDLDLTVRGAIDLRSNHDKPLKDMADGLAKALSQNKTHFKGVQVNIEQREV